MQKGGRELKMKRKRVNDALPQQNAFEHRGDIKRARLEQHALDIEGLKCARQPSQEGARKALRESSSSDLNILHQREALNREALRKAPGKQPTRTSTTHAVAYHRSHTASEDSAGYSDSASSSDSDITQGSSGVSGVRQFWQTS